MPVEVVTRPYARQLVAWARHREEVLCLSADLTGSCELDDFREAYPDRFLSLGMAEQNMIGVAAGLAREGFTPLVHTFGVFLTRRVYDQVAMSVAYPNLRVRLLGFLPGLTTPGGVTHQANDDVALMRALPNMTILDTGDATEVETVLDVADAVPGPVYCRVLRGEVPRLFPDPMRLDRVRVLSEGEDLGVVSSGICTGEAMRALTAVRDAGVSVAHLHVGTLKPFGDPVVHDAVRACRAGVITMENHSVIGGLGAAVAELLADAGIGRRLARMGLQDTFAHGGSRPICWTTTACRPGTWSAGWRSCSADPSGSTSARSPPTISRKRARRLAPRRSDRALRQDAGCTPADYPCHARDAAEPWRRCEMVAAYVLIQTEVGKAGQVARAIAEIKGVHEVEPVAGPYDVIARAEARGIDDLGRLVMSHIQAVNGVTRTLTCAVTHL